MGIMGQRGVVARWMYRAGSPNPVATVLNRWWATVGMAGVWPRRLVRLEVRGRRSGRVHSFPVMVADLDGEQYLVAMLGEQASWVSNVRAARGRAVIGHGRREAVELEEVDPGERARSCGATCRSPQALARTSPSTGTPPSANSNGSPPTTPCSASRPI
jgi:hypothetical protein